MIQILENKQFNFYNLDKINITPSSRFYVPAELFTAAQHLAEVFTRSYIDQNLERLKELFPLSSQEDLEWRLRKTFDLMIVVDNNLKKKSWLVTTHFKIVYANNN